MFCSRCGKETDGNFCSNCGTPTNAQATQVEITTPPSVTKKKVNVLGIIGFVLSLAAITSVHVGAHYYFSDLLRLICSGIALAISILGLIFSRKKNKRKGLAIAGIIIGGLGFVSALSAMVMQNIINYIPNIDFESNSLI